MTWWLVQNAVFVVPLAACTAIACRLLRSRPAICHALWLLVLIKLLMPPVPVWKSQWLDQLLSRETPFVEQPANSDQPPTGLQIAKPGRTASPRVTEVIVIQPADVSAEQNHLSLASAADSRHDTSPARQSDVPAGDNEDPANNTTPLLAWAWPVLFSLWTAGAMIALAWHLRRAGRLRRVLKSSALASPSFRAEVALHCARLRLRVPQVRLTNSVPCPIVMALPRATLLWPGSLEDRLNAAGARAVLLHELAHLKRRDHLTAWLEVVVACLWWWHPVVWWARRQLRQFAELSCDAWVIAQTPQDRTGYAKALVDVCEFISLAKPATAPAVGMARGNRRSFERRLHMILRQRIAERMSLAAWISVVAIAVLMLPAFSTGQDDKGSPDSNAAQSNTKSDRASGAAHEDKALADPTGSTRSPSAARSPARTATFPKSEAAAALDDPEVRGISKEVRSLISGGHELEEKVLELQKWIIGARGTGRSSTTEERYKAAETLQATIRLMQSSGVPDKGLVAEIYLQILGRQPRPHEASLGLENLRAKGFAVGSLVENLLRSSEFIDGPDFEEFKVRVYPNLQYIDGPPRGDNASIAVQPPVAMYEPARSKQAPAQTLLRVVYDMPRDKSEALARFLKDHVAEGDIDLRTVESGLVVTAEETVQRTIVGVVSLMLGEPITLDLGDLPRIGYPMNSPVYQQSGSYGPQTYFAPTTAASAPPGVYLPAGPQSRRMIVPRTVVDPATGTRRTVHEERVYNGEQKTDDPATPRFDNSLPQEKNQPATTKEAPPRP